MNNIDRKKTISKIKLTKEQQEEVDHIINNKPFKTTRVVKSRMRSFAYEVTRNRPLSMDMKKRRLNLIYGGICTICHEWPDYKVEYDYDGAKRIERYCKKWWPLWKDRL